MKTPLVFSFLLGLLILAGFLQSQPSRSKPIYKVYHCYDNPELDAKFPSKTSANSALRAKVGCAAVLNEGAEPVLYMGRGSDREHLFLLKTQ